MEFCVFNSMFRNLKEKYTFYEKMLRFKLVDLYVVNNFVSYFFSRISYNLTGKWNLDIDFFQVLTNCNFPNFSLIQKCYWDDY